MRERPTEHQAMRLAMQLHNLPGHPHWSEAIDWRPGRWDPLINAPTRGSPILHIRGRASDGRVFEPMHYACGDGDGLMPSFDGWFVPVTDSRGKVLAYHQVDPVEWQPLGAKAVCHEGSPNE
jgi:hypothetical protein